MRTLARLALALLLFVVATFGLGEAAVRLLRVEPRVAIFRQSDTPPRLLLSERHGRVVWRQPERAGPGGSARENLGCEADRRVHLYGDSIAFGAGLDAADSLGPRLQAALGPGWCVRTFAQPGSTVWPQLAFAMEHVPADRPQVVVQQLWYGSPRVPTRLGDAAYDLHGLATDADGYPTLPAGLGGAWHHALFDTSRFWAWMTFALATPCPTCGRGWEELVATDLTALHRLVGEAGGRLVLLLAPPLDRSLESLRAEPVPWYDPAIAWAAAHGVEVLRMEDLWGDARVEDVRRNTCCHHNEAGADALARALAPRVEALLPPPPGR